MPRYRYEATDAGGNRRSGELEAAGPEQAAARLEEEGLLVENADTADVAEAGRGGASGRLSERDVAELSRQVAGLSGAGLPLASGLRALGDELAVGPLRRVLAEMADHLEAGGSLEDAVAAQGERFPPHLRGLVLAGLRSGRLGEVLEQFARYHNLGGELRRKIWLSLAYPIMLASLVSLLFFFVSTLVVQGFLPIFNDFGVPLPTITVSVIAVARVATDGGFWAMVAALLLASLVWLLGTGFGGGRWGRGLSSRIPLVGPLRRWTALVGFSHLLALLLESEVPLASALQWTGDGLRDADIAAACRAMRQRVEAGGSLADAMSSLPQFPPGLAPILRWAERHQSLPGALRMAGEMFEARARSQASFLGVACTALAVIVVLWGVCIMVLSLFLPLISLIARLSG